MDSERGMTGSYQAQQTSPNDACSRFTDSFTFVGILQETPLVEEIAYDEDSSIVEDELVEQEVLPEWAPQAVTSSL